MSTDGITLKTYLCNCCQAHFTQSETYYDATLILQSAKGQIVFGTNAGNEKEDIDKLLKKIEESDPGKLEEDIYMKREFCLCSGCRQKLLSFLNLS